MQTSIQADSLDGSPTTASSAVADPSRDRNPVPYSRWWSVALFCSDLLMFCISAGIASQIRFGKQLVLVQHSALPVTVLVVITWLLVFERLGLYRRSFAASFKDELYYTLAALSLGFAPVLVIFAIASAILPSRMAFLEMFIASAISVGLGRAALHALRSRLAVQSARRIAVVGTPGRVDTVVKELTITNQDAVLPLSLIDFDENLSATLETGHANDLYWVRSALDWGAQLLIVTEAIPPSLMPEILRLTESHGVKLAFAPTRLRMQAYDFTLQKDGGLALICPRSLAICTPGADLVRRVIDVALVLPALLILAPLFLLTALAILIDDGGPVIYRQIRVGRLGKEFEIFKFRSMPTNAEAASGPVWSQKTQRKVTRIGGFLRKTSIDELPQLFNVLRGDMSIVGPRPERPFYVEKFRKILPRYDERHLVRPGITGWSHIHMKRDVDLSAIGDRLAYDLFYIEHWSLFMDVSIVVKTGAEFLFHRVA
jgi:exopolysaccharide biosynthesis polyprenyl glycosylphosphotransferase